MRRTTIRSISSTLRSTAKRVGYAISVGVARRSVGAGDTRCADGAAEAILNDDVRGLPQSKENRCTAAKRLRKRDIEDLLVQSARVDQQVKGAAPGDPWETLEDIDVIWPRFEGRAFA